MIFVRISRSLFMKFEWDREKARTNLEKHGVDFREAAQAFFDLHRTEDSDMREDYGEDRFVTTGRVGRHLLTIVYTERGGSIRLLSARRASLRERNAYDQS